MAHDATVPDSRPRSQVQLEIAREGYRTQGFTANEAISQPFSAEVSILLPRGVKGDALLGGAARLFRALSVPEIVNVVLCHEAGYGTAQLRWSLQAPYPPQPHVLQCEGEDTLAFVQRLLARAGIWWTVQADDKGRERLLLADTNYPAPYRRGGAVSYRRESGQVRNGAARTQHIEGHSTTRTRQGATLCGRAW